MRPVYFAELRDSWPAWLGVSLAFVAVNLSFVNSALVLASGWAAVHAGVLDKMLSAEFTLVPISNFVFSGLVGVTVLATSASMVVDSRRGALARLSVAGATPRQVVRSVMGQLVVVSLLSAVVADVIGVLTLEPYLHFLATGLDSSTTVARPDAVFDVGSMLLANLGCVLVAVLGGFGQARRASRVPPVEALRQAAVLPAPRMTALRWFMVAVCALVIAGLFAAVGPMTAGRDSETVSAFMQMGLGSLILVVMMVAMASPILVGPLARAWTAVLPVRDPIWQVARMNIVARGARLSRSVVPIVFTIGLMLGLLTIGPTIAATTAASGYDGGTVQLDKAGMGAFLSLLGPAPGIALCGGIGNLFMTSRQRDAELALLGVTGATPAQRKALPVLEAVILTVTAAIPAAGALAVMAAFYHVSFAGAGLVPVIEVPLSAWVTGIGGTMVIMVAATSLPTLPALERPEPRVIARLAAE